MISFRLRKLFIIVTRATEIESQTRWMKTKKNAVSVVWPQKDFGVAQPRTMDAHSRHRPFKSVYKL